MGKKSGNGVRSPIDDPTSLSAGNFPSFGRDRTVVKVVYSSCGTYVQTPLYTTTINRKKSMIAFRAEWEHRAVEEEHYVPKDKTEGFFSDLEKAMERMAFDLVVGMCDASQEELTITYDNRKSDRISVIGELPNGVYELLDRFKATYEGFREWANGVLGFRW